ncbi:MAG: helix-turn-helix domain-containing protein [Firmicutes bacterium]|nr:helix-turn-helix domain-containing protein [Bacillota bacterium]
MNFAENLKKLRKDFRYTQKDLAEKLKLNQSNISDWENGISRPDYENLIKLADIFDVSIDELLGRE